jgi:hypothetical protein
VWTDLIGRLYPDAEFTAPASDADIDRIGERLGQAVPEDLRALLQHSDGVRAEHGSGLVWSAREIIEENTGLRADPDLARLYMSFDQLMFVGDNGGGDLFGFVRVPGERPDDVFVWDHETDERSRVSASLRDYLERRAAADGDDWYR